MKIELKEILDLNKRELIILLPLALAVLFFGVYPEPLLSVMHSSVENLILQNSLALENTINQNVVGMR